MKTPVRSMILLATLSSIAALALNAAAQSADAGAKKAAMCIGCHSIPGYQASFPEIYKVPMIAGQGEKYIVSALAQYRKGDRKHPTMRAIATSLTDQDMADLAAFYAAQGKTDVSTAGASAASATAPMAPANVAELLKKGNCVACHGANFNTPIDPTYPKLYVALKAYKTTNNPKVGRGNAVMSGMATPYTLSELKLLSGYIATLPSELKTVPQSRFR